MRISLISQLSHDSSLRQRVLNYFKTVSYGQEVPINRVIKHFLKYEIDPELPPEEMKREVKRIESNIRTYVKQFVKLGLLTQVSRGIYKLNKNRDIERGRSSGVSQFSGSNYERALARILADYNATHGWQLFVDGVLVDPGSQEIEGWKFSWSPQETGTRIDVGSSNNPIPHDKILLFSGVVIGLAASWGASPDQISVLHVEYNVDFEGFVFDVGKDSRVKLATVTNLYFQLYYKPGIGVRSELQLFAKKGVIPFKEAVDVIRAYRDAVDHRVFLHTLFDRGKEIVTALGRIGHHIVNELDRFSDTISHHELVTHDLKLVSQNISQNVSQISQMVSDQSQQLLTVQNRVTDISQKTDHILETNVQMAYGFAQIGEALNRFSAYAHDSNEEIISGLSAVSQKIMEVKNEMRQLKELLDNWEFRWGTQDMEARKIWVLLNKAIGRTLREIAAIAGVSHETIRRILNAALQEYPDWNILFDGNLDVEPLETYSTVTQILDQLGPRRRAKAEALIAFLRNNPGATKAEIKIALGLATISDVFNVLSSVKPLIREEIIDPRTKKKRYFLR